MKQIVITLIGLLVAMTSCGNKAEDAIERDMASGVVLVQNQSYIEVVLPDGESVYFSSYDKEDGLMGYAAEEDSVEKTISFGTGFFISNRGEIATNNHIVANSITDKEIVGAISSAFDVAKMEAYELYKESREQYDELIAHRSDIQLAYLVDEISDYEYERYNQVLEEVKSEMDEYESTYTALNMTNMNDCEVIRHSEISIAYNDTHITNTSDFIPCVVTKTDAEHDLAVIQLKDKQTPESKHVFEVPDKDQGTMLPDITGGFSTTLKLYDFDLSATFDYQIGGKLYDNRYMSLMTNVATSGNGQTYHKDVMKSWTAENPTSDIPRWQYYDSFTASRSTRFLTNASYLNFQSFTVGYTLPKRLTQTLKLSKVRIYCQGENIYFWSKRQGLDPRYSFAGTNSGGVNAYSPARTIMGGIQVSF